MFLDYMKNTLSQSYDVKFVFRDTSFSQDSYIINI